MCGVHGFNWKKPEQLKKMIYESHSRGPDENGEYYDSHISIGHNLLAITERSSVSKQPINYNSRFVLSYNGEIYNYKKLKDSMPSVNFKTDSDTEVLYHGLRLHGQDFIKKLDGMYAICWYDKQENTLLLARDTSGVKPLYYSHKNLEYIAFSSSIKSLQKLNLDGCRKLDPYGFELYMSFGYVPGNRTCIKGIQKLYPGQVIVFDASTSEVLDSYHTHVKPEKIEDFSLEQFSDNVSSVVKSCLMGRRNIGLFLSGGLDSCMILHEARKHIPSLKTFTTRFDCPENENQKINSDADAAKKLAGLYNSDHTELLVTRKNFISAIEPCIEALEEPRYNRSSPAYYLLNKLMSEQGIVVTLSGDGGDEVFTGYPRHCKFLNSFASGDTQRKTKDCKSPIKCFHNLTKFSIPYNSMSPRKQQGYYSFIPQECFPEEAVNAELFVESMMHLPEDYLIRNDKLGMNFSMEGRFPFTVPSFKNYCLGIPSSHKFVNNNEPKRIPKTAYKDKLPDFITNKFKTGWAVAPSWFSSKEFKNYQKEVFSKDYHRHTNRLFNLNFLSSSTKLKSTLTPFYFRVWAQKFNITL
jgi:asparagine synthase (glutamine-hydrolysing)|tara:strand:- start:400 stop:2142 length:1743 start_codon:yes stop_codon:yes gene_type:complete